MENFAVKEFLSVTEHFLESFEIKSINIACESLQDNHTGEYLSEMINKICDVWFLSNDKIVSITNDNDSNIVKARSKHVRSLAHTLNLVVDNLVNIPEIKLFLDTVRKVVNWFQNKVVFVLRN